MIEALDLAGRLVVSGALALAAVLKLADLTGLRGTLYLARVTRPWVPQLTVGLPLIELAGATALLSARAGWPAAVLSAGLLLVFIAFLAADRTAGQGCNCFGRRSGSSRRAGIVRNVGLIAALVPAMLRGPGAGRLGVPESADRWLFAGAALVTAGLLTWAFRRDSRLRRAAADRGRRRAGRPATLSEASHETAIEPWPAPEIDLPAARGGGRIRLADLPADGPTPVVFVEIGCSSCGLLLARLSRSPGAAQVLVVVAGAADPAAELAVRYRLTSVAVDQDGAVTDAYRVTATPGACLISPDGTVVDAAGRPAARPAIGVDAVTDLLAAADRW